MGKVDRWDSIYRYKRTDGITQDQEDIRDFADQEDRRH
jgi:hypothetical protein